VLQFRSSHHKDNHMKKCIAVLAFTLFCALPQCA
jgi:hypothetical protein